MNDETADTHEPQVNPAYAEFQMAKALTTAREHADAATRERAEQKITKWMSVLTGILNASLHTGSRTPIQGVPGWVTLEVVTGGFVTGAKLAGGPLLDHERALLARLPPAQEGSERRLLNSYYLTDEGLKALTDQLQSGCYDIGIPEEGALLVVAWLAQNGHSEAARELLEHLGPFFHELRFFPAPTDRPRHFGTRVFLQSVGDTIDALKSIKPNPRILTQKEAVEVWTPLYDSMVALFLETVEGPVPFLVRAPDGKRATPAKNARFPIEGGWPCRHYPDGWKARAQAVLDQIEQRRHDHKTCSRPERTRGTFAQLREFLLCCVRDSKSLGGRDVGRIRLILAGYVDKRGTPDSMDCRTERRRQERAIIAPTFHVIAQAIVPRLAVLPKDEGLDDFQAVARPIDGDEAARWKIPLGTAVPPSIQAKIQRCLNETVNVLVEHRVITSAEVLANLLPQITAGIRSAGISNPSLRQLYAAIYRAFRRRRSLLLLNLQSQIRIDELPWVAAIDRFRAEGTATRDLARQSLEEVSVLTLRSFPHVIIPNKLVKELRALAKGAALDLPFVDELAADIFMGEFGANFLNAAQKAANLLQGTLYEIYYGIDYQRVRQMPEPEMIERSRFGRSASESSRHFAQLCSEMAGVSYGGYDAATSGMIIEQQQVLTTQNLAVLFEGLNLRHEMGGSLFAMAQNCLVWVCRRQQMTTTLWHAKLIMLKNTAYAWRQMVFFLSLLPEERVAAFLSWASEHLDQQADEYRSRFRPALSGLILAARGQSPGESPNARRFLGWSKKRHWLLGNEPGQVKED